jgi:hypothetical protein
MVSIVDLMVLHETTCFTDVGMFPLFTHLSADYRLRHLVNNVAMRIYTPDYIRMEITVLYLKIHGINCRFNDRKYPFTGSASASPVNSICNHQISN